MYHRNVAVALVHKLFHQSISALQQCLPVTSIDDLQYYFRLHSLVQHCTAGTQGGWGGEEATSPRWFDMMAMWGQIWKCGSAVCERILHGVKTGRLHYNGHKGAEMNLVAPNYGNQNSYLYSSENKSEYSTSKLLKPFCVQIKLVELEITNQNMHFASYS